MVETNGERWLREHNVPDDLLDKYLRGERDDGMKTVFFIQVLLSCGMEFDIVFREKKYFVSPVFGEFTILSPDCERVLYETDDLDDFGENARIGENGEFYLKDVVDELEF